MSDVLTSHDPEVRALLDKQAIREVVTRYFRGLDRFDAALIASAYHPDAIDDHGGRRFTGENVGPGVIDWFRETHIVSGSHHLTHQTIHLDGDTAGCESYMLGFMLESHEGHERTMQLACRYLDRLERRNGEWRIAERLVVPEVSRFLPDDTFWSGRRFRHDGTDEVDPSYALLAGR